VLGAASADDAASADPDHYSGLVKTDMPLDQKVDNLGPGRKLICHGTMQPSAGVA
jgi:hypothetical protein